MSGPLSTARPSGLHQYQPGAPVYARGKRWKVVGLDLSSPWIHKVRNQPGIIYAVNTATFDPRNLLNARVANDLQ